MLILYFHFGHLVEVGVFVCCQVFPVEHNDGNISTQYALGHTTGTQAAGYLIQYLKLN